MQHLSSTLIAQQSQYLACNTAEQVQYTGMHCQKPRIDASCAGDLPRNGSISCPLYLHS